MAWRDLDPRLANETMIEALDAALWAGHLTSATTVVDVANAVRGWFEQERDETTAASLLRGFSDRLTGRYPTAVECWRGALQLGARDVGVATRVHLLGMVWTAMGDMLDFENDRGGNRLAGIPGRAQHHQPEHPRLAGARDGSERSRAANRQ
jgi:hypothetical protein